jgi:hypothetical protein
MKGYRMPQRDKHNLTQPLTLLVATERDEVGFHTPELIAKAEHASVIYGKRLDRLLGTPVADTLRSIRAAHARGQPVARIAEGVVGMMLFLFATPARRRRAIQSGKFADLYK